MSITHNFHKIKNEIGDRAEIVVAAKTRQPDEIIEVIEAGASIIGENYVQEAKNIKDNLPEKITNQVKWHLIGHLQTNKINQALRLFNCIQTVDSIKIANALQDKLDKQNINEFPIFLEINIGNESTKTGITLNYLTDFLSQIKILNKLKIIGIMCMEPYSPDPKDAIPYFKKMQDYFKLTQDILSYADFKYLSMGMSHSYSEAVKYGSNMVRIGSSIFGPRL